MLRSVFITLVLGALAKDFLQILCRRLCYGGFHCLHSRRMKLFISAPDLSRKSKSQGSSLKDSRLDYERQQQNLYFVFLMLLENYLGRELTAKVQKFPNLARVPARLPHCHGGDGASKTLNCTEMNY